MDSTRGSLSTILFKAAVAVAAFALVFFALQRLLSPKYASYALEGGLIREYYDSPRNHDVIFIGDCEVYANFSTVTLWEEYGITSYIRGSPQQLIWQSYYLMEDTIRSASEIPKVIVFNIMSMQYNVPQYEPYNRLTLDGMRWSPVKADAIRASRTDGEDWLSYLFPFFRYKDNWRDVGAEDLRYFFKDPRVSVSGFMIRSDIKPVGFIPDPLPLPSYDFGENAYYYLESMVQLTREHGIELVLVKAPNLYPHWHRQWDEQIVEFAAENDLIYINFLEYIDDVGLDFSTDTFNAGMHLNVYGAELLSRYFGGNVLAEMGLPDRRTEPEAAEYWKELAETYHAMVERQQDEIAETGEIRSFLIR